MYQIVVNATGSHSFYVKADSLHSVNVIYSYEVEEQAEGRIMFDETTGLFCYIPTADEYKSFVIKFSATNGTDTISEDVIFSLMPQTAAEVKIFQSRGILPDAGDYTVVATTTDTRYFNNETRLARSVSISGKDVVFDDAVQNKVWGLSGCDDIYELNIYAERLIIRSALTFPQTDITVYARELVFEDKGNIIASINTTPKPEQTLADGIGANGNNGGNISLYINGIKANAGKRLLLHGTCGQSTNRNGTPGNGGNGGTVRSTIDVSSFCDFVRGLGGVKYDVAPDGAAIAGPVIGQGEMGNNGCFELVNKPSAYLHPYYIAAVMRHANDAFINNCTDEVLTTCREYRALIDEYLGQSSASENEDGGTHEGISDDMDDLIEVKKQQNTDDILDLLVDDDQENDQEKQLELHNDLIGIESMLFKLEQGLDYFGNPDGWVPLMSFEVYLQTYEEEIDRAIPTLYMYYWLNRIDQTLQNKVRASQFAADATEEEMDNEIATYNSLILEIPVIEDETAEVTAMIADVTQRLEALQKKLLRKAKHNVRKRNRIKKIFGLVKTVANVLPITGPVGTAVGATLDVGLTLVSGLSSNSSYGEAMSSAINIIGDKTLKFENVDSYLYKDDKGNYNYQRDKNGNICKDSEGNNIINRNSNAEIYNRVIKNAVEPLVTNVTNLYNILSKSSTPKGEVQQELNRPMAKSKTWKALQAQINELNNRQEELLNHMNQVFSDMTTTVSDISNNIFALDAFDRQINEDNSKRDLNAMLYIEDMEQKAKSRLLKYHYYLRKAYEYRLLKAYEGEEFNLVGMFERFEKLGLALDSVVNEEAYEALGSVFEEVVSDMTERIIDEYTYNLPEQSLPITIVIPKEQLDVLNSDEVLNLNFHDIGLFSPSEENVRIVDIDIRHIDTHVDGSVGSFGRIDLNLSHSGVSTFCKDGNLFWFNHMARNTSNPHNWGVRYDVVSNEKTYMHPSAAQTSLLSSLVGGNNDLMLFSRPSAWSDIVLTKEVQTATGKDIVIDSLVLTLTYDFTRRPDRIRNIDITANEDLMPYVACSEEDVSGRSSGNANLYRSFNNSSQKVTFTAVDRYESYRFKNWTDRGGNVVSEKNALTVSKNKDQYYIANYEYWCPVLNVPTTIKVGNNGGTYTVNVANVGLGDTEMDWYVSDSLSTWVHLNGVAEGIDDGSFTFTFDANETGVFRVDSLEIFASETDEMSKVIYIVQDMDISQYPNLIYIDDHDVFPGQRFEIPIKLKNEANVAGLSTTLVLPKGISLAKDGNGNAIYSLNGERARSNQFSVYWTENPDGSIALRIMPSSTTTISGTDGVVLKVAVDIASTLAKGDYEVMLTSNNLSVNNGGYQLSTLDLPRTHSTLSVVDGMLGDVNADSRIDLTDAIMIVYHSLGVQQKGFIAKVADVNGDGRIDLTDAISVVYKSLGVGTQHAPIRIIEPE